MRNQLIVLAIMTAVTSACDHKAKIQNTPVSSPADSQFTRNKEAREDSLELAEAYHLMGQVEHEVLPIAETEPVKSLEGEDAADDPAFWYNQNQPEASVIYGTNKKGGIYVYDLSGRELAYYPVGMINNIDIRQKVVIGSDTVDILGGSNRTDNSIVLFEIENGSLKPLLEENFVIDTADIDEVYGFCLYKKSGTGYAVVNGKNGTIQVYEIYQVEEGITLSPYLSWQLSTQPEGMVVDDENLILYIGEEENGIWRVSLEANTTPEIIPSSQRANNSNIEYDIEGLALYKGNSAEDGFLLASIQGSFTYAVFDRTGSNQYLGNFKISSHLNIDQVEETDGLELYSGYLNQRFDKGLLIVQDGFNFQGDTMVNQNFKFVPLKDLLEVVGEFDNSL